MITKATVIISEHRLTMYKSWSWAVSSERTIALQLVKMHLTNLFHSALVASYVCSASSLPAANDTKIPLRIGVLYEEVQLSDLAGLDLLGQQTPEIMAVNANITPALEPFMHLATPMKFLYISSSLNDTTITPTLYVQPTHTYDDAPRDLDILYIGGPNPNTVDERSLSFMREASKRTKVILTTCTGAMWLAKSGVLNGKKATTNRSTLDFAKKSWPNVQWQDQRWVIEDGHFDGAKIWTSGGAGCGQLSGIGSTFVTLTELGIDMLIEFTDQTFDKTLVQIGCQGLDFPYANRSQFYTGPLAPLPTAAI
jgi:hypothetical protein